MSAITELRDCQYTLLNNREDMEKICLDCYTKLYSTKESSFQMLADKEAVLNHISNWFTSIMV